MTNVKLKASQLSEVKETYVDIVVDRMSREDLAEYVTETLLDRFNKMPQNEFKDHIWEVEDEYLYDELVENVQIEDVNKQWQDFQEIKDNRQIGDRFWKL